MNSSLLSVNVSVIHQRQLASSQISLTSVQLGMENSWPKYSL